VPVTDEQRAMLQLLLEGGQGYDDIGSLLGIAPDEVRSRARSALTEIGGADPDAQIGLSDYLLGQADPIGRADAVRHLQSDPEANALAQRLAQNLRLLAPKADLPEIPEPRGGRRAAPPPPPAPPPASGARPAQPSAPPPPPAAAKGPGIASRAAKALSGRGGSLSGKRRTQAIVGGAALLALVVVVIVLVSSGGGGGSDDCAPINPDSVQTSIGNATLDAVGDAADQDCKPSGLVSMVPLGQQGKNGQSQLAGFAFQMKGTHLEPTSNDSVYILWIDAGGSNARALGRETVGDDGNLNGAAAVTSTDLALLQSGTFKLSLVTSAQTQQIQQELKSQGKKGTGLVSFVGTPVLQGSGSALLQQVQQALQAIQQQSGGTQTGTGTTSGSKG
jgi:hypothetical protein